MKSKITSEVKETINGVVAEEEFYGYNGKVIGYWAYGCFDPNLPYQGFEDYDVTPEEGE